MTILDALYLLVGIMFAATAIINCVIVLTQNVGKAPAFGALMRLFSFSAVICRRWQMVCW